MEKVIGYKRDTFEDRNKGTTVEYCHLYTAVDAKNVVGQAVNIYKVAKDAFDDITCLTPGDTIKPYFDRFGKVAAVDVIESAAPASSAKSGKDTF